MSIELDYDKIMSDPKLFYSTVYTPLSEALKVLEERQKDPTLKANIEKLLNHDIPLPLQKDGKHGVQFRQVATPNHDTRWFVELTKDHGLNTVFFEYLEDKFTSNNSFKHSLGQLHIHGKINKKGENIEEKITVVDFAKHDGKKLKDIPTNWSESFADFHKKLFDVCEYSRDNLTFYDSSAWLKKHGPNADGYYFKFLLLFVSHGILFENFLFEGTEGEFTKKIFLPAFFEAIKSTGVKPLIVPIPPMDDQENPHWISYPKKVKTFLNKLQS